MQKYEIFEISRPCCVMESKVKTVSTREIPYSKWIERHLPTKGELEKERRTKFDFQPMISIVVPAYKHRET